MLKRRFFLFIFAVPVLLLFSFGIVSAQKIDTDSMDNAQLMELLLQILNKLQQEEQAESGPEADTAVSAAGPEPISEIPQIMIYGNKKLVIETLPEYMFIGQKGGGGEEPEATEEPEPVEGEPCGPVMFWGYCGNNTILTCGCG